MNRTRAAAARFGRALRAAGRRTGSAYGLLVVRRRWWIALLWAAAAALTPLLPTPPAHGSGGSFSEILPLDSPALRVEERSLRQFRVPVLSGTTVVLHTRQPLGTLTRIAVSQKAFRASRALIDGRAPTRSGHLIAALPVPLVAQDTAVTYLFFSPGTTIWTSTHLAHLYASDLRQQSQQAADVAVTGFVPAQVSQAEHLAAGLPRFELLSVLFIAGIVALVFRSVLAPVAVLAVGAAGYLVYSKLLATIIAGWGVTVPAQLEPVVAALFLGVVTDYCVLFFSGYRDSLARGLPRLAGVRRTLRLEAPVVAVAGITVAGGISALLGSPFEFFRALGPALALTVLAALVVSLTLTPALMAILGPRLFRLRPARSPAPPPQAARDRISARLFRALTTRRGAPVAAVLVLVPLVAACVPLLHAGLSLSFTAGLPADDQVARGARTLSAADLRGITAPTEVLVEGHGVTVQRVALRRLQTSLESLPGVARVIGPAQNPSTLDLGVVLADSGDAARFIVILDSDPLGGRAVQAVRRIQAALPTLVRDAGVERAVGDVTGQSRIASEVARLTRQSLQDTMLLAVVIELLVLVLYLRSVLAPLGVLVSGLLTTGAALGLTVLLFQDGSGQPGLTFYAPFSTAVLLLALGADYTVFTVGAIWREARRVPFVDAIRLAMPANARAVTGAGAILATTFASVAAIPLVAFQQIAFTMAAGLLLDTVVVRPLLTPAILVLLGRAALWPARRLQGTAAADP